MAQRPEELCLNRFISFLYNIRYSAKPRVCCGERVERERECGLRKLRCVLGAHNTQVDNYTMSHDTSSSWGGADKEWALAPVGVADALRTGGWRVAETVASQLIT